MRHATCDMQHATCNMRHATRNMRQATCDMCHVSCLEVSLNWLSEKSSAYKKNNGNCVRVTVTVVMVTYINITVTILVCVKNNIDYFGRTYVHIKIQTVGYYVVWYKKLNKIKEPSMNCSYIWHIDTSKSANWLDTHSMTVWWRYVFTEQAVNALHTTTTTTTIDIS